MKILRAFLFILFSVASFSVNATELINIDSNNDSSKSNSVEIVEKDQKKVFSSSSDPYGSEFLLASEVSSEDTDDEESSEEIEEEKGLFSGVRSFFNSIFHSVEDFIEGLSPYGFRRGLSNGEPRRLLREEKKRFREKLESIKEKNKDFDNESCKENEKGYDPNELCPICYTDSLGKKNVVKIDSSCGHCFHKVCLEQWFESNKKCPLCRGSVDGKKGFVKAKYKENKVVKEKEIKRKRAYQDRNDFEENSNDGGFSFKKPKEKDIKNELNEKNNK